MYCTLFSTLPKVDHSIRNFQKTKKKMHKSIWCSFLYVWSPQQKWQDFWLTFASTAAWESLRIAINYFRWIGLHFGGKQVLDWTCRKHTVGFSRRIKLWAFLNIFRKNREFLEMYIETILRDICVEA